MKHTFFGLSLFCVVLFSCQKNNYERIVLIEVDSLDNQKSLTREIIKTFNKTENKLVSVLTKIHNKDNDYKTLLLTGIGAKDGLSEWLLDSVFYPDINDTIIVNYKKSMGDWKRNQKFLLKYNKNNKIEHFKTERLTDMNNSKKEIFYTYDTLNRLIKEVEYECSQIVSCDSFYKKEYYYNMDGLKDSVRSFYWKNSSWEMIKQKNKSR